MLAVRQAGSDYFHRGNCRSFPDIEKRTELPRGSLRQALSEDRDFYLYNVVLDSVDDSFIDAHLIGESVERQIAVFRICEKRFVAPGDSGQVALVESSQVSAAGSQVQVLPVCEQGDLNEQFGIIVKIAADEAGDGDHGAIGGMVQASETVFFRFGRDELHFLFVGSVFADFHSDQAALFFLDYADFGEVHCQQGGHVPAVSGEGCPEGLQMGDPQVQVGHLLVQEFFQVFGGAVFHEILYHGDGDFQLSEQKDGFQHGALVVIVAAVSVFRVDGGGAE